MRKKTHATAITFARKRENLVSKTRKPEISPSISSIIGRVLHLQRTVGNRAVQRLLRAIVIQAKVKVDQFVHDTPMKTNHQKINMVLSL